MNKTLKVILVLASAILLVFTGYRLAPLLFNSQEAAPNAQNMSKLTGEANEALERVLEQRKKGTSKIPDSVEVAPPQAGSDWEILMDLDNRQTSEYGYEPLFTEKHRNLAGKMIRLEGYIYPLEETPEQSFFILSFFPIQACFFCGGAGPESAVEINAKKPITFTDKKIRLKGRLQLNDTIPERLFYILNEAELLQ